MRKLITLLVLSLFIFQTSAYAIRYTRGYSRRGGSFVMPHYSSSPNRIKADNWSSSGNVNL